MSTTSWDDVRQAAGVSGSNATAWRQSGGRRSPEPGQLSVVAQSTSRIAGRVDDRTRLTAAGIAVIGAIVALTHMALLSMFASHPHWVAAGAARHLLAFPVPLAGVVVSAVGTVALIVTAVVSRGFTETGDVEAYVASVAAGANLLTAVPALIVLVMYLLLLALFVVVCVLIGAAVIALVIGLLSSL